jgi:hypothetical protein
MAAEQIPNTDQTANEVHRLLINKCGDIEDRINELRGLITILNLVFTCELISDENISDLFYATQVIKDKFNELVNILQA